MPSEAGAVPNFVPLAEPLLVGNEWKYVKECLDTGWVSSVGPFVERFEREVAGYVGAAHGVAVASGTAGLHTALLAVGVGPDDEVLVSDLSFIATANAVRYCHAYPVFMDVDAATWQMDPEKVEEFLRTMCERRGDGCYNRATGRRVRAIVPVHILGFACAIERIVETAREYGLRVVEDAAEALGVRYRERHAGTFGDIGVLSFNGNKVITAGGGGVLVTDNRAHAEYARYLSTQAKDDAVEWVHNEVGYNYRLTNIQAAVGVAQLEQLDPFIEKKRAIAARYEAAFRGVGAITTMPRIRDVAATYWLYTVLVPEATTLEARRALIKRLNASRIGARPLWHPGHTLPPYRDCPAFRIVHSPRLYARGVSLPSGAGLTPADQQRCIDVLLQQIASLDH